MNYVEYNLDPSNRDKFWWYAIKTLFFVMPRCKEYQFTGQHEL